MAFSLSLWLAAFPILAAFSTGPETDHSVSRLVVKVRHCAKAEGNLMVAVYSSQKELQEANPLKAKAHAIVDAANPNSIAFDLPPGNYAVMVMHDRNGNRKLDTNWLGIPTEPVGVSNGFKSRIRKPTFAECALDLRQSHQYIDIQLEQF